MKIKRRILDWDARHEITAQINKASLPRYQITSDKGLYYIYDEVDCTLGHIGSNATWELPGHEAIGGNPVVFNFNDYVVEEKEEKNQ